MMHRFPTRWQWDSPGRDVPGWHRCPRGSLWGPCVCKCWDTPSLQMLSPNKELLEQISASRCDLGILWVWLSWQH